MLVDQQLVGQPHGFAIAAGMLMRIADRLDARRPQHGRCMRIASNVDGNPALTGPARGGASLVGDYAGIAGSGADSAVHTSAWPVTNDASAEARNSTHRAISLGLPILPSGWNRCIVSRISSVAPNAPATSGVSMMPGQIQFTRTPAEANSSGALPVTRPTPSLAPLYSDI